MHARCTGLGVGGEDRMGRGGKGGRQEEAPAHAMAAISNGWAEEQGTAGLAYAGISAHTASPRVVEIIGREQRLGGGVIHTLQPLSAWAAQRNGLQVGRQATHKAMFMSTSNA